MTPVASSLASASRSPSTLVVLTDHSFSSYVLPPDGRLVLGREESADVVIDDPSVSRRHAILHLGDPPRIEDAGSATGVSTGGRRLAPGQTEPVALDQSIHLGAVTILLRAAPVRPLDLLTRAGLERRLREEHARAARLGHEVAIVRLRVRHGSPALVHEIFQHVLRPTDVGGQSGLCQFAAILPSTSPSQAEALRGQLAARLDARGASTTSSIVAVPRDERDPAALLVAAPPCDEARTAKVDVVVRSPAMREIYHLAERIARSDISVLILGETGVGKEVLAETIHRHSARADRPFIRLNCAALSESLLESELFGHERGAFTGAVQAKPGLLETAAGGTVFLDEIGELPVATQVKLLRVLEERQVLPVGGIKPRRIDVRFIAATNRDLEAAAGRGAFRQDLYFRLNGISLLIPPLRERTEEIPDLARQFVASAYRQAGHATPPAISDEALARLQALPWPGNIRELRNVIERALLLGGGDRIGSEHVPCASRPAVVDSSGKLTVPRYGSTVSTEWGHELPDPERLRRDLELAERQRVLSVLERCAGNQTQAAKILGVSRRTLLSKLDAYGVPRPRKNLVPRDPPS